MMMMMMAGQASRLGWAGLSWAEQAERGWGGVVSGESAEVSAGRVPHGRAGREGGGGRRWDQARNGRAGQRQG